MTIEKTSRQRRNSIKSVNPSKKRWLWFWLGMGGVAALSATLGGLLAISLSSKPLMQAHLNKDQASVFDSDSIAGGGLKFSQLTRPVNILLMGMSVLPPDVQNPPSNALHQGYLPEINSFDGLSDVMLLLRFDPDKKKVVVLSIPRDTRVQLEAHGIQKINSTNVYGGPALTAKTISNLLDGVEIDRYIRINVLGVAKLIDALGGVTVYVPKGMKYNDFSQHLYVNLKAGEQHLDGDHALQLLRFRHDALGDIGRIQRQQMVMRALISQALTPATLTRLPDILNTVKEHIDTNLTVEEILALAGFGATTNRSKIQMLMLPGDFGEKQQFSYWIANKDGVAKQMSQYFDLPLQNRSRLFNPASLRVAIQDRTGNNKTNFQPLITNLERAGYRDIYMAKAWGEPLSVTRIIAQQGDNNSATSVYNTLGFGEVRIDSTGSVGSDVSIQVGKDWLQHKDVFEMPRKR